MVPIRNFSSTGHALFGWLVSCTAADPNRRSQIRALLGFNFRGPMQADKEREVEASNTPTLTNHHGAKYRLSLTYTDCMEKSHVQLNPK